MFESQLPTRAFLSEPAALAYGAEALRTPSRPPTPEDLHHYRELVTSTFSCLVERGPSKGQARLTEWRHRAPDDMRRDIQGLDIYRAALIAEAEEYVSLSGLSHPDLDWLFADLLLYAELLATANADLEGKGPLFRLLARAGLADAGVVTGLSTLVLPALAVYLWLKGIVSWVVLLVAGGALIGGLIEWRRARLFGKALAAMRKCYAVTASTTFSWSVLWAELECSRAAGAVWDGALYRLVEQRKTAGEAITIST